MFKKSEPPKQLIRLSSRPLLSDLQKYAEQVIRAREKSLHVCWNSADNMSGYTLAITSVPGNNDPQWRLSSQSGPLRKDLWFYVSADVNKIFTMCVTSLGEDVAEAYAADTRALAAAAAPPMPGPRSTQSMTIDPVEQAKMPRAQASSMTSPAELLTGNLAVLHITNLLQSISMGKMTGRLHIDPASGPVEVFFEAGAPVHALSKQSSGEEAFLEVVALNNGSFVFEPNLKTDPRSITHALDSLILKGIQLVDCLGIIEGAGVTVDSIAHRSPGVSEADFEQRIRQGAPIDMALQKQFYIKIDSHLTIRQLADLLKLPRSEWVPVVSNLIKVGLATFTASAPTIRRTLTVQPKRIDPVVIEQFAHHLKKPDTGAYTYPALLYFLNQEYQRHVSHDAPVSIILLDIRLQKPGAPAARGMINPQSISLVVQNIVSVKRDLDLVAHYEGQSLAVLLPNTHGHEALALARRIANAVIEARITVGMEKLNASSVLGIASLPSDVATTAELLSAAEMAKEKALTVPDGIQLFCELT